MGYLWLSPIVGSDVSYSLRPAGIAERKIHYFCVAGANDLNINDLVVKLDHLTLTLSFFSP